MAVGNYWDYQRSFGPAALPSSLSGVISDTLRQEIRGYEDIEFDDGIVRAFDSPVLPVEVSNFSYSANLEEGLYRIGKIDPRDSHYRRILALPFPAKLGAKGKMLSWHNPGSGPDFLRDTLEVRLVNLEAEIKTPAGNFRALEYRYRLPDDITLIENLRGIVSGYLVPGLGLVAIIIRDEKTEEVIRKSLLVSYRIQ